MLKKSQSKIYFEGLESGQIESYRNFRDQIIDTGFDKIKNKKKSKLAVLQRSTEFFNISKNLINFIKLKDNPNCNFILPYSWCNILNLSFKNKIISHILFCFYVTIISYKRILKSVYVIIFKTNVPYNFDVKQSVYLFNTPIEAIKDCNKENNYCLTNWLNKNIFKKNKFYIHSNQSLIHSNLSDCKYLPSFLPPLSLICKIKVLVSFLPHFFLATIKLTLGSWKKLYMLDDFLNETYFKKCDPSYFIKSYIFPYIGTQYRPSWTNEVIKNNSLIYMLNYSSSSVPNLDGKSHDNLLFRISSWPIIIPFNKSFVNTIKQNLFFPSKILNNSTVFFTDEENDIKKYVQKPFLAVFDVFPVYADLYIGFSSHNDYIHSARKQNIDFHEIFFRDLLDIAKKHNLQLVLKPKRNDPRITGQYKKLLVDMEKKKDLIILPYGISPYKVVDASYATVVQPFTSVGFYQEKIKI